MKLSTGGDSEILGLQVDRLLLTSSSCWNNEHFLDSSNNNNNKIDFVELDDDESNSKSTSAMDDLDILLKAASSQQSNEQNNNNLAELKPLPPFTGYTGHLSINGISGHHFHTIASAPSPPRVVETNNNTETTNQNTIFYTTDQVVSSSTMDCSNLDSIKTEVNVDYNSLLAPDIEDIAAIIGSAIADTTVSGNDTSSRDSWMDLDAWIDTACSQNTGNGNSNNNNSGKTILSNESIQEFVTNSQFNATTPSPPSIAISFPVTQLKRELSAGYTTHMPLLQSRLQNGPPKQEITFNLVPNGPIKQELGAYSLVSECPSPSSSTQYLAHSPPGHVVSTSDLVRYNQVHSSTRPSPELQVSFPHTTTPSKKSKSRSKTKSNPATSSSIVYNEGSLGKEKPVHRCTICNRGFLNKSNIKVHLRTHTGEKPFRCEVCGKAFRQKAHLIKHAQIHKRIGRD